ncbi:MAG TPA: TIGR01244 family phosphatase, partial [Gammaproteobacteria bacterium]|nr:TIGR01244 family phosphatase [Gammaproteobacteria bacterium]
MNDVAARVSVGPQIQLDDLAVLKAQGIEVVINNRPDGE